MLSWNEIVDYIEDKRLYKDVRTHDDFVSFEVRFKNDRRQMVFVEYNEDSEDYEEWIRVASPIGKLSSRQLDRVLQEMNYEFIGGLIRIKDVHFCCSVYKLSALTLSDLDDYIENVAIVADIIEEKYLGVDKY